MPQRISALATSLEAYKVPKEIVFIPEGEHHIYPQTHPDGILVKMPAARGAQIAAAMQDQLTELQKGNIRPRLDFDHNPKGATSGFPTGFRYQAGKGVMCAVEWSGSGKRALEGGDYGYFSPVVDLDENNVPVALPDRGPLGGLVNEPAFREIPRIAAGDAGKPQPKTTAMPNELVACGLLTETEAARTNAGELATTRVKAFGEDASKLEQALSKITKLEEDNRVLQEKVTASETKQKEEGTKRADDMIAAAVADGRLNPKDEATKKDFHERIAAGDAFAEKMLSSLTKKHDGIDTPVVKASAADTKDKKKEDEEKLSPTDRLAAALAEGK
jgi:phage I-like protein